MVNMRNRHRVDFNKTGTTFSIFPVASHPSQTKVEGYLGRVMVEEEGLSQDKIVNGKKKEASRPLAFMVSDMLRGMVDPANAILSSEEEIVGELAASGNNSLWDLVTTIGVGSHKISTLGENLREGFKNLNRKMIKRGIVLIRCSSDVTLHDLWQVAEILDKQMPEASIKLSATIQNTPVLFMEITCLVNQSEEDIHGTP